MKLNLTQKKVLCALNAHPAYSDRQLADTLGMKRSTVTLARHFLQRNEFYKTYLFPNFEKLGVRLIAIKYGNYGKIKPIDYQKRMKLMPKKIKIEENVFSLSSDFKGLSMFFAQDLCPIKEKIDAWNVIFEGVDPNVVIRDLYFPKKMIKTYKFMDLQRCLASALNLLPFVEKKDSLLQRRLTKNEIKVLRSWIQFPSATNNELSEMVNISKSAIGQIKKRLLKAGVARILHVPNWFLLNQCLVVLTCARLRHKPDLFLKFVNSTAEVVFLIGTTYEVLFFAVFRDYDDYQKKLFSAIERFKQEKVFTKEPDVMLFLLEDSHFIIDAVPFLQKYFGDI